MCVCSLELKNCVCVCVCVCLEEEDFLCVVNFPNEASVVLTASSATWLHLRPHTLA